jgi:hypothetical protein
MLVNLHVGLCLVPITPINAWVLAFLLLMLQGSADP